MTYKSQKFKMIIKSASKDSLENSNLLKALLALKKKKIIIY